MSPSHARKGERRYRYYISSALLSGHPDKAGSLPRVSAGAIEDAVAAIAKAEACSPTTADPLAVVHRVEVGRERLVLSLDGPDRVPVTVVRTITLRHRHSAQLIRPEGHAPATHRTDATLIKALALATRWATQLEAGEVGSIDAIARHENRCERYTAQILPLAYLAPDLAAKILHGCQPTSMTLAALTDKPLPLTWAEQRRRFAAFD